MVPWFWASTFDALAPGVVGLNLVRSSPGPIAEQSKSSDHSWGDLGSITGEGRFFYAFFQDGELS